MFRPAGRSSNSGLVTPETMALLTQDYIENKEMFTRMGNAFWKTCIAGGVTPKEFEEKGLVPRADSIETFMMLLPMGFNPEGAGDTKADYSIQLLQGKRKVLAISVSKTAALNRMRVRPKNRT